MSDLGTPAAAGEPGPSGRETAQGGGIGQASGEEGGGEGNKSGAAPPETPAALTPPPDGAAGVGELASSGDTEPGAT